MDVFVHLWVALAVGLLIGVERGWQERSAAEGSRVAGIRTFGLMGLLGGLWALLAERLGDVLLGFAFVAFAGVVIVAHLRDVRLDRDVGITTVIAALVTFALGALAARGEPIIAAACGVLTATLLSLKPLLHHWLEKLEAKELYGALKLLLISVVLLPVLPNESYGPWGALNPYRIWWFVVLIATISFAGYFAMKIAGTRRGVMLTSLLGGLASSTAVTLSLARLGRQRDLQCILAAGILAAAGTMFPRILLEVAIVNPTLLLQLTLPMILMMFASYGTVLWFWRQRRGEESTELPLRNPFEIRPALQFGLLLVVIMLLTEALQIWMGEAGIYLLALVSGLADVDAITLSLADMARGDLAADVAAQAIVLAAMMNTLVKGIMAFAIAGIGLGGRVLSAFGIVLALGGLGLYLV